MPTSSMYDGLKFVTVLPNTSSSQRGKQLAESAARSHAAIIAHRKKKAAKSKRVVLTLKGRAAPKNTQDETLRCDWIEGFSNIEEPPCHTPLHVPSTICLELLAPNTLAVHQVFRVGLFLNDFWLRCLSNETFRNAFLARVQACRGAIGAVSHISLLRRELNAIQALRHAFARDPEVDEQSMLAMMQLGLLEGELGTSSLADTHMDAVSRVLQQRLGDKMENGRIRPMLAAFILTRAMETNFPRLPEPPIDTPQFHGPIQKGQLSDPMVSALIPQLPSGFAVLAKGEKLSIEVLRVLDRVSRLRARISQGLSPGSCTCSSDSSSSAEAEFAPNFWSACPSLTVSTALNEEPEIDNLLALGLWLYVALEFSNRPVPESMLLWISMSRSTRQELSTRLMRCLVARGKDEDECLTWLFEIAIASWIGPSGTLLLQGATLLDFRMRRFHDPLCPFDKFFEFTKRYSGI